VAFYRRRLPHFYRQDQPVFITWRLFGSLPPNRSFPDNSLTSGEAFVIMDRLLEETRTGPFYLQIPSLAKVVSEAIRHNADTLNHYILHAWVVMPNHVHLLVTPKIPLPKLTKSLKGITAKRANELLGQTGKPFWQEESYDHLIRSQRELDRIQTYIEQNPVRAGLASDALDYAWSSAAATQGSSAAATRGAHRSDQAGRPQE
jgi:putative DNA methylase